MRIVNNGRSYETLSLIVKPLLKIYELKTGNLFWALNTLKLDLKAWTQSLIWQMLLKYFEASRYLECSARQD